MGRYATSSSISLLLPNWLNGNTTSSDTYGADIWSTSADRAEGYVNAAIVARYDPSTWTSTGTPVIPPLVRKITEDLACLYAVRSAITQDASVKNANLAEWEKAEATLFEIRDGLIKLADTQGALVPTRSGTRFMSSTQGYNHIFGMDNERTWGSGDVEQNAIDDDRKAGGAPSAGDPQFEP